MSTKLPPDWHEFLFNGSAPDWFIELMAKVDEAYRTSEVYPPKEDLFSAFHFVSPSRLKVVILGQDPYHQPGQAHGLAFSVQEGVGVPPSLRNIFTERMNDLGVLPSTSGNLSHWAMQGVLLLNTCLTVIQGQPGSHQSLGWNRFTDLVIAKLGEGRGQPHVFILWGKAAIQKTSLIAAEKHCILEAPHPSPLSAYRGFFGSKPFSKANTFLKAQNMESIDWA